MEGADPGEASRPGAPVSRWLKMIGALIAVAAVALCVRAVVQAWPDVHDRLANARGGYVVAAAACSAGAMTSLALTWWRCLRTFGVRVHVIDAVAWHFGGELGKYVPGGVWTVLGRGELARRGGAVPRSATYATTLITYAITCVAAASVGGVLAATAAGQDADFAFGWAFLALVPLALITVHPLVVHRALQVIQRASRRPLDLSVPRWSEMLRLVAWSAPAWLFMGAAASFTAEALGGAQEPVRVAFAAVAAWLIGFLAVPVPAGVGVREVIFVVLCGLPSGPAAAVAAITRGLLVLVDALGGFAALGVVGHRQAHR